jgi:hypothetical protein
MQKIRHAGWGEGAPKEGFLAVSKWLADDNAERPHSTHGILTPDEAYANKMELMRLAA